MDAPCSRLSAEVRVRSAPDAVSFFAHPMAFLNFPSTRVFWLDWRSSRQPFFHLGSLGDGDVWGETSLHMRNPILLVTRLFIHESAPFCGHKIYATESPARDNLAIPEK